MLAAPEPHLAVAAYIRLTSRSQAKFHNKRNWVTFWLLCGIRSSWDRSINSGKPQSCLLQWSDQNQPDSWWLSDLLQNLRDHLEWRERIQEAPPVVPGHWHGVRPLCPGVRIRRYKLDESSVVNVENESTCGSPHLANTGCRRSMAIVHSVFSVWPTLDRESAWILCTPGRWMGTNIITLQSHHLSSRMVICISVYDRVPPSFLM